MKTAYSYIRFSTPEQQMGDSERRQLEGTKDYCQRLNMELADVVTDRGTSAFHGKHRQNGALGNLLKRLKKGDALIIEDTDRWSRESPLDALNALRDAVRGGIEVHFRRTNTIVTEANFNDMGVIVPNFFGSMLADQESKKKSERVGAAWKAKRAKAAKGEQIKLGRYPAWLRWDEQAYKAVVDEPRAAVVRRMFTLAASGHGCLEIARVFNAEKVAPITNDSRTCWCLTSIRRTLKHKAALGCLVLKSGDEVPGYFPAIVDEPLFYKAQARLQVVKQIKRRLGCDSNIFCGLVHCRSCGSPMTVAGAGPNGKWSKFICQGARAGRTACRFGGPPVALVETTVLGILGQLELLRPLLSGGQKPNRVNEIEVRIADIDKQLAKAAAVFWTADVPQAIADKINALSAEKKALAPALEAERSTRSVSPLVGYEKFLLKLPTLAGQRSELRRTVASVLERVGIDPVGVNGTWRLELRLRGAIQGLLVEVVREGGWRLVGIKQLVASVPDSKNDN